MAALSPALSNNSTDTTTTAATTITPTSATKASTSTIAATTTTASAAATTPVAAISSASSHQRPDAPKTQRGLNKPKCIKCGNVARSRCPYQSCKSCCSKAQNPCHIHVLKPNATFPDKIPSSSSPLFDQQSTEVPSGNLLRVALVRQLSSNFAQFNNVQIPIRSKKPLTRKDAAAINEWRFSKLKEYKDRNIELEDEAFDRYMQNISLLEEVFSTKSDGSSEDGCSTLDTSMDNQTGTISGLKLKLKLSPIRTESFRKRIREIVDQGLMNLQKFEVNNSSNDIEDESELGIKPKKAKTMASERASVLSDLMDKLNKARNEEDLKSCLKLKSQLYNLQEIESLAKTEDVQICEEQIAKNGLSSVQESFYSPPKMFRSTEIDQETLNSIDLHFSSLEQIEDL